MNGTNQRRRSGTSVRSDELKVVKTVLGALRIGVRGCSVPELLQRNLKLYLTLLRIQTYVLFSILTYSSIPRTLPIRAVILGPYIMVDYCMLNIKDLGFYSVVLGVCNSKA